MVAVKENDSHRLLDKVMISSSKAVPGTSFVILGLLDCGDVSGTYTHIITPIGQQIVVGGGDQVFGGTSENHSF